MNDIRNLYGGLYTTEELLKDLDFPKTALYLFRVNLNTGEKEMCIDYAELSELPDIKEVIEYYGYETHDFEECLAIYGELFENDNTYLPFDNNEIYISKDNNYEGCCTRGGHEFTTKEWHYYFNVLDVL